MMLDIDSIVSQVKYNCNISDARYWGEYSPCGLLLRLRDLYKIENSLKPRDKISHDRIGEWIDRRERLWQELITRDFRRITILDRSYHPYDIKGVNSVLMDHGLLYGAGYGNLLKPVFLLAELSGKYSINKYKVHIAGREISRCLSTAPAMIRGNAIITRLETMNMFIWNKYEEMKAMKCSGALFQAFSEYGISKDTEDKISPAKLESRFAKIAREELWTYIHHEIGEASQRRILGRWWKQVILKLPHSRAELFLRGIKDILSDTCRSGMLAYIIKNKKAGSLAFYVALLGGFRKNIFPDIISAYEEFTRTRSWRLIEKARVQGYNRGRVFAGKLREFFDKDMITREIIEQELMPKIG
jgi:hypothetical protein